MKQLILFLLLLPSVSLFSQTYPSPEFINEVYAYRKDKDSLVRLEKESSKMESKTKIAGFGGAEYGYFLDGERSAIRLVKGQSVSFIYSNGANNTAASPTRDSLYRANGLDPSMTGGSGSMMDPSSMISLYKAETVKGKRKILMQKMPGASIFSSKKSGSSDKYTFGTKKIREGYWELVPDKSLPKGEYAFSLMTMGSMDGGTLLFAFGID